MQQQWPTQNKWSPDENRQICKIWPKPELRMHQSKKNQATGTEKVLAQYLANQRIDNG